MHQCMNTFLVVDMVIPVHVRVRNVRDRMSLVRSVDAREFDGIPNKEDWQTVEDEILVSFFGKQLHGPPTNITDSIGSTSLSGSGGDTGKKGSLLSFPIQKLGICDV